MVDHTCRFQVIHKELIMIVHRVTAYISPRCGAHMHTRARNQIMRNVDLMHINRLMGDDGRVAEGTVVHLNVINSILLGHECAYSHRSLSLSSVKEMKCVEMQQFYHEYNPTIRTAQSVQVLSRRKDKLLFQAAQCTAQIRVRHPR